MGKYSFRNKITGWSQYSISFEEDSKIIIPHEKDEFMKAFLSNYILRPSCYACQFKDKNYYSDVTLGDFWNINNVMPTYNDNKGVSEVIINTEKGKRFFSELETVIDFCNVHEKDGYQESLYYSLEVPKDRSEYFIKIRNHNIKDVNAVFLKNKKKNLMHRLARKGKKVLIQKFCNGKPKLSKYFIKGIDLDSFVTKQSCCGCSACYNICPRKAISMELDEEGFLYPQIDKSFCINCGLCEKVCPIFNVPFSVGKIINPLFYAAKNLNEEERLRSSSGGVFIALAKIIINKGGVVFGASFEENYELVHIAVSQHEKLKQLMGSKYIPSKIGHSYNICKKFLDEGKLVLFSGTPCQIAGLKSYLRKDYLNLITVDVICHGVPSAMVFKKYFNDLILPQISSWGGGTISFRDKSLGWSNFSMKYSSNQCAMK